VPYAERRPSDAVHVTITDHYIAVPIQDRRDAGERNGRTRRPTAARCPLLPDALTDSDKELYSAVAQLKNQASIEEGMLRLEAAIAKQQPAGPILLRPRTPTPYAVSNAPQPLIGSVFARSGGWPASSVSDLRYPRRGSSSHRWPLSSELFRSRHGKTEIVKSLAGVLADAGKSQDAIAALRALSQPTRIRAICTTISARL